MKRSELNKLYKKAAEKIGFKEDPTQKGWMPKLGPNDYKCKIVHGFTENGPVTLTVGPKGVVDLEALKLAGDYALAEKKNIPCVVLPKVWNVGDFDDLSWVVRERVNGTSPLEDFPPGSGRVNEEVIRLYWNTVAVFSEMEEQGLSQAFGEPEDPEGFMRKKLEKWIELSKFLKNKRLKQKLGVFESIAGNVFRYIFYESNLWETTDLEMDLFFRNFGNTDIVVGHDKSYYLPNPEIILLPQFYGAAYFVWNILMYSYDRYDDELPDFIIHNSIVEEVERWRGEFYLSCPNDLKDKFHTAFYLLLFERVIATLLVDIPLKRSPFDVKRQEGDEGAKRAQKAEIIFVEVLKYLLGIIPTLVKNEPFEENFAALEKVYKD